MCVKYVLIIFCFILFASSCSKSASDTKRITFIGSVVHADTKKGIEGIRVITEYGELCCVSFKKRIGGDSTITDQNGNFKIQLEYPIDSLRYRFVTSIPAISLTDKFYVYFGNRFIDYGVVGFDYYQMVAPADVRDTIQNDHIQTCNFTVLPCGFVTLHFEDQIAPFGEDTIKVISKRLDINNEYSSKDFLPSSTRSMYFLLLLK